MKKCILIGLLFFSTLCIQSCFKRDFLWGSNYICAYYQANSTSDWMCDTILEVDRDLISISIQPKLQINYHDYDHGDKGFTKLTEITSLLDPETREAALFDSLSRAWNDQSYKIWKMEKWSSTGPIVYGSPGAVITVLTDIVITCDNAWNESHPAGSKLNDIFDITYYSYYPFIINNYNKIHLEEDNKYEPVPITKPLAELGDNDMKLLSIRSLFTLKPKYLPKTPGAYNLTICAYDSDSTEYLRGSCYFVIR